MIRTAVLTDDLVVVLGMSLHWRPEDVYALTLRRLVRHLKKIHKLNKS